VEGRLGAARLLRRIRIHIERKGERGKLEGDYSYPREDRDMG